MTQRKKPTKKERDLFDAVSALKALVASADSPCTFDSQQKPYRLVHGAYVEAARKLIQRHERKK